MEEKKVSIMLFVWCLFVNCIIYPGCVESNVSEHSPKETGLCRLQEHDRAAWPTGSYIVLPEVWCNEMGPWHVGCRCCKTCVVCLEGYILHVAIFTSLECNLSASPLQAYMLHHLLGYDAWVEYCEANGLLDAAAMTDWFNYERSISQVSLKLMR